MNFALPAILLLVMLMPGLIFVLAYQGRLSAKIKSQRIVDLKAVSADWLIAAALAPGLHWAWVCLGAAITPLQADLDAVFALLAGLDRADANSTRAIASITTYPGWVISYFFTLYIAAGFAGSICFRIVRHFKLDRKLPIFRFNNEWHYLFSGEGQEPEPAGAMITVAIEHSSGAYLYSGLLENFSYGLDGDLLKIVITGAVRRSLSKDREIGQAQVSADEDDRYYRIAGDRFVIWCEDVCTLNVRYYRLDEAGKPEFI